MLNDPIFLIEAYRDINLNITRSHYLSQLFVGGTGLLSPRHYHFFFSNTTGQWNVEVQSDTNFPNETCIYSNRRDMIVHSDRIIKLL